MESHPQNPDFRFNPENFYPYNYKLKQLCHVTKIQCFFLTLAPQYSITFILKKVSAIPKRVDLSNKKLTRPLLVICSVLPLNSLNY